MTAVARRMFVLQLGAERIRKALSLRSGSPQLYWEPFPAVVVDTTEGWVLLDTGMSRTALDAAATQESYAAAAMHYGGGRADPSDDRAWHLHPSPPDPKRWTWGLTGDPLAAGLAEIGLQPSDLALAAVSHLHLDHSGGIPTLSDVDVPVAIQEAELRHARSGQGALVDGYHAPDWSHPATTWRRLAGDTELAPGVHALSTPGHTPGHMSFRVDLERTGSWIFCADAADLTENLYDLVPPGSCGADTAAEQDLAQASLSRLLDEARHTSARLIPGHDQVVLNAVRHPAGGHR